MPESTAKMMRRLEMQKLPRRTVVIVACDELTISAEEAAEVVKGQTWIVEARAIDETSLAVTYNPRATLHRVKWNIFKRLRPHIKVHP